MHCCSHRRRNSFSRKRFVPLGFPSSSGVARLSTQNEKEQPRNVTSSGHEEAVNITSFQRRVKCPERSKRRQLADLYRATRNSGCPSGCVQVHSASDAPVYVDFRPPPSLISFSASRVDHRRQAVVTKRAPVRVFRDATLFLSRRYFGEGAGGLQRRISLKQRSK